MTNEDKYLEAIKALKSNRPILSNKEKLTDTIMRRIKESSDKLPFHEKLVIFLFGWVNIYWLRGTMAVAAVLFTGFFIIQQLIFADRLGNLEKQLARTVNTINDHEPELGINQKILLNIVEKDPRMKDSITVSTSDLEDLLNDYLELQNNYEIINQNIGMHPYLQRRINQSSEERVKDDKSRLKI